MLLSRLRRAPAPTLQKTITVLAALMGPAAALAQSTAFTYQGQLKVSGVLANTNSDFRFTLFDAATNGNAIAGPFTQLSVPVVNGLFTTTVDFGPLPVTTTDRWLQIGVRSPGGGVGLYTNLGARQKLTPDPIALYSMAPWQTAGSNIFYIGGGVGIGTTTPTYPLSFPNTLGDKIALWGQSGNHYGFGIQGGLLQIYASDTTADIAFGSGQSSAFSEVMRVKGAGLVGINTTDPDYPLDVRATGAQGVAISGENTGNGYGVVGLSDAGGRGVYAAVTGTNSGVGLWAQSNASSLNGVAIRANNSNAAGIGIWSTTASNDANVVVSNSGTGDLIRGFSGTNSGTLVFRVENNGHVVASVIEITGGSDVAEPFEVNDKDPQPGMVVAMDAAHPGELRIARTAYDTKVAGIISGAGGVKPGLTMGESGTLAAGKHNVALSGRVYCWCDASQHPIHIGDILTTSNIPGHAMYACDHVRAQGAIIGKAMTDLPCGRGLVLVLVSLQ